MGGAERQALHLARYLKSRGHDVVMWSCILRDESGPVQQECARSGIPTASHRFLWPCRKSSLLRDSWRLLRALRQEKPEVILSYCTSPNVGMGLVWKFSTAKACFWGQRDIHSLHGDRMERLAYRRVSGVICNATHEIEYLRQMLGEGKTPIRVIHNGLVPATPELNRDAWREKLKVESDAILAIMLAHFRPEKDHTTLLLAWQQVQQKRQGQIPKAYLILAGAPQTTFSEMQSQIETLGLQDTVRLAGQVQDVTGLLEASDISLLISHHEGLSNSVLESMASALPMLASDLSANREALGEENNECFCPPGDNNVLATKLLRLIEDEQLRKDWGGRNQQRAKEHFSIEALGKNTLEFVCSL